jgi:succinyl-CoA synthetase alpha subunit
VDLGVREHRFRRRGRGGAHPLQPPASVERVHGIETLDAIERCAQDDAIRVVVFTGEGRAFSAGADVKD